MKFYSWKDIERKFGTSKEKYEHLLSKIEVYPDSVIIYKRETTKVDQIINHRPYHRRKSTVCRE